MPIKIFLVCSFAAIAILFLRQPDALLHPQFWAEDGKVWFADAYNMGPLKSLLRPQDGYFQTLSRVTADVSLLGPIESAPLIFVVGSLLCQMLPFWLLLSVRMKRIIPDDRVRLICAILFLFLPNTAELHGNITNGQWYLALAACFVVISDSDGTRFWNVCDIMLLALAGLSGPFALLLGPIAFVKWLKTKRRENLGKLLIIAATATLQATAILFIGHAGRLHHVPELSGRLLGAVVVRQVLVSSLVGAKGYLWLVMNVPGFLWLVLALGLLVSSIMTYAALKGPSALRLFLVFAGLVLVVSLLSPTGDFTRYSALKLLSRSDDGVRYWLIPMSSVFACLVWGLSIKNHKLVRHLAAVCLAIAVVGMAVDFEYPKYVHYDVEGSLKYLELLPSGQGLSIPINPAGWKMELRNP